MSQLNVLTDGAMLVEDGIITHIGPAARVENLAVSRKATELDASGCIVMPAFIDSHTHIVFGPPRLEDFEMRVRGASEAEIEAEGGGLMGSVRAMRAASGRRLVFAASKHLNHFLRQGTTTIEAKSGYGLDEGSEMKSLRAVAALAGRPLDVVPTFYGGNAIPPEYAGRADAYMDYLCSDLMPKIARRGLARFADIRCDSGAFSAAQARRYLETAQRLGLRGKMQASQHQNIGGVAVAAAAGAVSVDRLEAATAAEISILARSGTVATLLPGAAFHAGRGQYAPARALIDSGAAVALATGFNPETCPTSSMPMAMALACRHMGMTPAEALTASTINAAHALGLAETVGSLEFGKKADFILMAASDYREIPYYFGVNLMNTVVKSGRILFQQREQKWDDD